MMNQTKATAITRMERSDRAQDRRDAAQRKQAREYLKQQDAKLAARLATEPRQGNVAGGWWGRL